MRKKVAVIGAGIAGLAAAYELGKDGCEVVVYERNDHVGGRMRTDRSVEGYAVDTGAQFFYDAYENTFRLCWELGIAGLLEKFESPYGLYRNGKLHRLDPPMKNPLSFFTFKGLSASAKLKLLRLAPVILANYKRLSLNRPDKWEPLDREDCASYTLKHLNSELLEALIQPLISGICLGEPDKVSIVVMLSGLKYQLISKLYALKGGIDTMPLKLAERCNVHLGTNVKRIVLDEGKACGVEIEKDGAKRSEDYDAVVCAVPGTAVPALIPDAPGEIVSFFGHVEYSQSILVMSGLERKLMKEIYVVAVPRGNMMDTTALSEGANKSASLAPEGRGLAVSFLSGRASREKMQESDEKLVATAVREYKSIVPGAPSPVFNRVYRWNPGLVLFNTGYISKMNRFRVDEEKVGGLFFAGDYLMTASVEGSLTSGLRAAEMAGQYLKP
ncbi:MAG: FAD-dependent oxidoreductase [bacterium]